MATPGINLDAMASLKTDELQKLIEILQGLAASRQEEAPTRQPPIPASTIVEEEAIRWEQVGSDQVPIPEASPSTRTSPPNEPTNGRTLEVAKPPSNPRPPLPASTFAEVCSKQQRTNSLAAYPAIFDLKDNDVITTSERMNILAYLPQQERPDLLIIVKEPTHKSPLGLEKLPFSYANRTALDGRIVTFSRDISAGETPPTIAIDDEWWNNEDRPVPTERRKKNLR